MNLHNSFYMKIIGCMQVGGDCSWILNSSLTNMSKIVDEIVLVGGDVSDKSKQIINQCNNVVDTDFYSNNRSRIEWNDMNSLLQMAKKHKADWILFMDADETLEPKFQQTIREYVENPDIGLYKFLRYWLWSTPEQYRVDRPEKFSTFAYNSYLVRLVPSLYFPNPAGPLWKRLFKHVRGSEKLRPYFGREPISGTVGKQIETDIVLLHHAALNREQFIKNQMWYSMLLSKRQPLDSEKDIVNQFYSILDESTLELKPINKDWL